MADPDFELRKGGGGARAVFCRLPCRLFYLLRFFLFYLKRRGGGGQGGVRSATASLFLFVSSLFLPPLSLFALLVEVNQACPSLVE